MYTKAKGCKKKVVKRVVLRNIGIVCKFLDLDMLAKKTIYKCIFLFLGRPDEDSCPVDNVHYFAAEGYLPSAAKSTKNVISAGVLYARRLQPWFQSHLHQHWTVKS